MFGKKKQGKGTEPTASSNGSLAQKTGKGWIHPDSQLAPSAGVCYGVRYVGCLEVKVSMRCLDFETRTSVARESINRVCSAAGLTTGGRKKKSDKKIAKQLGDMPYMKHAGANVNLTISTEGVVVVSMDSGETISDHLLPNISFASGGDPDTIDFVSYVAKDPLLGRACHVFECGGGLAQDVIQTIGQAFELKYKQHVNDKPDMFQVPDRLHGAGFSAQGKSLWDDEDPTYVNDSPQDAPEEGGYTALQSNTPLAQSTSEPSAHAEVGANLYTTAMQPLSGASQHDSAFASPPRPSDDDRGAMGGAASQNITPNAASRVNYTNVPINGNTPDDEPREEPLSEPVVGDLLQGFSSAPTSAFSAAASQPLEVHTPGTPDERWFHGPLTRKEAEERLQVDGDFLVRESTSTRGQYVLSGIQNRMCRHLLLVDPNGVVRTKDRSFDSVSHLINFHHENALPIISQDSELLLQTPVARDY